MERHARFLKGVEIMAITVYVAKGGKVKTTVNSFERKGSPSP